MKPRTEFETSPELKRVFLRELDSWRKQSHLGLHELSQRCGVSQSYLAHIGRYGRVPSKPVLLLLALNFGMAHPEELLRAASLAESWPFDEALTLAPKQQSDDGFLSVKFNMQGLIDAIQSAVRAESRPKSLRQLLSGRALRIGLNYAQPWLFHALKDGSPDKARGIVPNLCHLLESELHCEVEATPVPFDRFVEKLCRGDIDLFGPLLVSPYCPSNIQFSTPTHRMGLSLLKRLRPTSGLADLPPPRTIDDLRTKGYVLAALKDSRAHHFCATSLKRSEDSLLVCNSVEEALDRVLLRGIPRPAHLFVTNAMFAVEQGQLHQDSLQPLFAEPGNLLEMSDNAFAVRPDWGDGMAEINTAVRNAIASPQFVSELNLLLASGAAGLIETTSSADARSTDRRVSGVQAY